MAPLKDSKEGMMLCLAIGDAFGIPYECKTYSEIKQMRTNEEEQNENPYVKCRDHPFIPDEFQPGEYTDDTQLSLAMMRALDRFEGCLTEEEDFTKKFMPLVVEEHVTEFERSVVGWGGTKTAIKRLQDKTHSFLNSGNVGAVGNGVIMKLGPLYLHYFYNVLKLESISDEKIGLELIEKASEEWMNKQLEIITKMTHDTPSCIVTACLLVRLGLLILLFGRRYLEKKNIILENLLQYCKVLETQYKPSECISLRLQLVLDNVNKLNDDLNLVNITNQGTFESVNSLMMVLAIVLSLKEEMNPFDLIIRAGTIGGDCDSNASMVGSLIGAVYGREIIPERFLKYLKFDEFH